GGRARGGPAGPGGPGGSRRLAVLMLGVGASPATAPPERGSASTPGKPGRVDRYGDPLPPGVVARLGTLRLRHDAEGQPVLLSPDGRLVVTVLPGEGGVHLWEADTGTKRHVLRGRGKEGTSWPVFSLDGKTLVTVDGHELCTW